MAVIAGTIQSVTQLEGPGTVGARKLYHLNVRFGTYSASADSAAVTGVPAAIKTFTKNGKTLTLIGAMGGPPGLTAAGAAVYASRGVTVNGTSLEFNLGSETAEADAAASSGVGIIVAVLEA